MNPRKNILVTIDSTPFSEDPLTLSLYQFAGYRLVRGSPIPTGSSRVPLRFIAAGGTGGYVYDVTTDSFGGLPPGLTYSPTTGAITGTPSAVGHYIFSASVQDSSSTVASGTFSLDVFGILSPSHVTPIAGEVGAAYSYQFDVLGATGAVTWSQTAGTIPAGLTFSSGGVLSGTPIADGISYFVVRAEDITTGDTLDIACHVQIYDVVTGDITESFLGIDPAMLELPPAKRGILAIYHAVQTGGIPGARFYVDGLPSGIGFDSISGLIQGITYDPATYGSPVGVPGITLRTVSLSGQVASADYHLPIKDGENILQPQKNGSNVGYKGPKNFNLVEGANITITASNDGETATYEIAASGGGGGGGVESVNGVGPDSSGNVSINLGSVDSVNGIGPDSSGNVELSIIRGPGCVFENGGSTLSGTLTSEIQIPYAATITAWTIAGDVAGSASIVVSHSTYAAYDTMTTLFTATCTTSKKAQATGLSYALSAGDILRFSGSGFSAFTRCSIVLEAA